MQDHLTTKLYGMSTTAEIHVKCTEAIVALRVCASECKLLGSLTVEQQVKMEPKLPRLLRITKEKGFTFSAQLQLEYEEFLRAADRVVTETKLVVQLCEGGIARLEAQSSAPACESVDASSKLVATLREIGSEHENLRYHYMKALQYGQRARESIALLEYYPIVLNQFILQYSGQTDAEGVSADLNVSRKI